MAAENQFNPTLAAENFQAEDSALQDILRTAQAEKLELPALVPPRNALLEWWEKLTDRFYTWLNELFAPAFKGMEVDPDLMATALKYSVVLILVVGAGYLIYRLTSDASVQARAMRLLGAPDYTKGESPPDLLEKALLQALNRGEYAAAARLRWVLFLRGNRLADGLTPLDYARSQPRAHSLLVPHYPLMFRKGSGSEPDYRNFENTLSSLTKKGDV